MVKSGIQIHPWYWLESEDGSDLGWHDCIVGEWSMLVGGPEMNPVTKRYRGPWFAEFQPTIERDSHVLRGPFRTVKEAKRAAIELAKDALGELADAIGKIT